MTLADSPAPKGIRMWRVIPERASTGGQTIKPLRISVEMHNRKESQ
jgi:hypothetical protein